MTFMFCMRSEHRALQIMADGMFYCLAVVMRTFAVRNVNCLFQKSN